MFKSIPETAVKSALTTTFAAIALSLSACGGGNDDPSGPEVALQSGGCVSAKTTGADACVFDPEPDTTAQALNAGSPKSNTVARDTYRVYKVASDTEVILITNSGDADLYLYNSEDFSDDNLLCFARNPFMEDNCTASDSDGELFAVVYGRKDSSYTISTTTDCSVTSINNWAYRNMRDYYLYADYVPVVNPASYADPADLMDALRFEELDPYSGISNAATRGDFLDEGTTFGFGYRWARDAQGTPRIALVYKDSPFGRANIRRGDTIVSIAGELWNEMTSDRYYELVGNRDNPRTNTWVFLDVETGESKSASITIDEFNVNTVPYVNAFTHPDFSGKIGYIVFTEFLGISENELDSAISSLNDSGVTELVLDLRYNPGGYTRIARKLASQIGGPSLVDSTLVEYQYNTKYSAQNYQRKFEAASPSLDLNRLVVLTTASTASSSELLINSLRPYMEVITVGEKTRGKPFISASRKFCGKALNAMEAQGVNASNNSVAGGIPASCYAADDPSRDFGNSSGEIEGMLRKSLDYYVLGTCDAAPAFAKRALIAESLPLTETPDPGAVTAPAAAGTFIQ